MMINILFVAVAGLGIVLYAMYVEKKAIKDPSYKGLCDITDAISCTKSVHSRWESLFGISNGLFGLGFYALVIVLAFLGIYPQIIFYA